MAESKKPAIELTIPIQVADMTEKSKSIAQTLTDVDMQQEMPTISTLLQRKKLSSSKENTKIEEKYGGVSQPNLSEDMGNEPKASVKIIVNEVDPAQSSSDVELNAVITPARRKNTNPSLSSIASHRIQSGPPPFRSTLRVEQLDFKAFEKFLKKHKKQSSMKKLDCIGYFSTHFSEVTYFEVNDAGVFQGRIGFGYPPLIAGVKTKMLTQHSLPSIFELLSQGECFIGAVESLRAEDQNGLKTLGFKSTDCVGVFPIVDKKSVTGVWICTNSSSVDLPAKEFKALKKVLKALQF